MMKVFAAFLAAAMVAVPPAMAQRPMSEDAAFLEGHWRGEQDGLVFEEVWLAPGGGVMTGMARGVNADRLAVLEYIIIADMNIGTFMRFQHFNLDYTSPEMNEGAITLRLVEAKEGDVLFRNDDPAEEVQSIHYYLTDADTLQADIALLQDDESGGFSLTFERVD
ncbi:MAG: DUF6265 family protein [Amphiplicatus sp.]